MTPARRLSPELERLALRALADEFEDLNGKFFGFQLRRPVFSLSDGSTRLGQWVTRTRTLELGRELLEAADWPQVVEVLKHEMAHQYVHEVLGVLDEPPHGPTFQRVCAERGFDGRPSGMPESGDPSSQRLLERIARLLALAESPEEHEAQAAALAAQRLMLKHNLASVAAGRRAAYRYRHLGSPTGRIAAWERLLAAILAEHYFVEVIWVSVWRPTEGRRGRLLEACGTPENLEMAHYAWDFLRGSGERLWREHKRRHGIRRDADRQSFLAGVMTGFSQKLGEQGRRHAREGLVWVGDAELEGWLRRRHPVIRSSRRSSDYAAEAFASGANAGRSLVLHRGVGAGPSAAAPAALPPRRR